MAADSDPLEGKDGDDVEKHVVHQRLISTVGEHKFGIINIR